MYLIDFFRRVIRKSNIPVFIYLVLNVVIIGCVISVLFTMPIVQSMGVGIVLYIISLAIALSPIGEWILRLQTGCKKIKRVEQVNYIEPLFREVYEKAKRQDETISSKVRIYINNDSEPNAFATGRKTICITKGLLNMPEAQIKATLAHEFGHLAHKDTDLILLVSVGNLIINAIIFGVRLIIDLIYFFMAITSIVVGGRDGVVGAIASALYHILFTTFVSGLTWIWTKIGVLLVMKTSRSNEYAADAFSYKLGYGNELCILLDSLSGCKAKGLFANLVSSHPDSDERIDRLQKLGATYRVQYGANSIK